MAAERVVAEARLSDQRVCVSIRRRLVATDGATTPFSFAEPTASSASLQQTARPQAEDVARL
jgi:hypothetical protein